MFSYFWDSEVHLNNVAFAIELLGCVIEVIIAIIAIYTFPKDWAEKRVERIKKLGESFAVVTAIIVLVVLISNRRTSFLQEMRQAEEFKKSEQASIQAQNAAQTAKAAALASITAAAKVKRRSFSEEQKQSAKTFLARYSGTSVGIASAMDDAESGAFARELKELLNSCGWSVPGGRSVA